jgi:hypothetical protein
MNNNRVVIQQAILSRKERLIETLFIFALQDLRCYSNAYEVFTVIISLTETLDELLRIGKTVLLFPPPPDDCIES